MNQTSESCDDQHDVVRLRDTLQALALSSELQSQLLPTYVCNPGHMLLCLKTSLPRIKNRFGVKQIAQLGNLEAHVSTASRGKVSWLPHDTDFQSSQEWTMARHIAEETLVELGWPVQPPSYNLLPGYVRVPGRSRNTALMVQIEPDGSVQAQYFDYDVEDYDSARELYIAEPQKADILKLLLSPHGQHQRHLPLDILFLETIYLKFRSWHELYDWLIAKHIPFFIWD